MTSLDTLRPPNRARKSVNLKNEISYRKLCAFIDRAEDEGLSKNDIVTYLKSKDVDLNEILKAYKAFCQKKELHEVSFPSKPLGFDIIPNTDGNGGIVSRVTMTADEAKQLHVQVGSVLYELNGERLDDVAFEEVERKLDDCASLDVSHVIFQNPTDASLVTVWEHNLKASEEEC